jgi:hypothetical protein
MRAAYLSILERHGDEVLRDAAHQHIAALAPPSCAASPTPWVSRATTSKAIAKLLAQPPRSGRLRPPHRLAHRRSAIEVTVHPSAALDDRGTPSPLGRVRRRQPSVISAIALAVNPRAQIRRPATGRGTSPSTPTPSGSGRRSPSSSAATTTSRRTCAPGRTGVDRLRRSDGRLRRSSPPL